MSDYLLALAAQLDAEPECRCVPQVGGEDTLGCPVHDPEGYQWLLDHPDGISAEELEAMDRYAFESCRDEGH